ncbi:MAG TPA: MBL fold metallo-hydrolase [Steroidobacteraceae bacterium]|jgi:glyoxylase-like metal-dependent hydrolase (beta-lactamase superfamily II)
MLCQRLCYLGILLAAASLAAAQEQDFSKVEIHTTHLAEGLYVLQGAGGNMTASVGMDGVLLVDDEYAALADKIRAALRGLGRGGPGGSSGDQAGGSARRDQAVRYVINTHYHFDHTGANAALAQDGATLIAQDNARARLLTGGTAGNGGSITREVPALEHAALPQVTFDHELTVHVNGDDVRAVHYPNAHTDGDTIVFFPGTGAVAMGDIYVRYGFPFIDINSGGSVQGMIAACEDVLRRVPAEARVVPGHGEVAGLADLREYLQMLKDTSAAVADALKAGKTLAQMKQERILGRWSERYSPPKAFVDTDAFTETLYNSLRGHVARHGSRPR